ncbi:hypothetical protein CF326_g4493 [Tilletia indica]|nr:hypothetical protein CF326_g4493 [Tilletia indica]
MASNGNLFQQSQAQQPGASPAALGGVPFQYTGQGMGMNPQQFQPHMAQGHLQQQQQPPQQQPQQQGMNSGGFNAGQSFAGLDPRMMQSYAAMQAANQQGQPQQQPRMFAGQIQQGGQPQQPQTPQQQPQQMLGWGPNQNQQRQQQPQQQQQQQQPQQQQQLGQGSTQQNAFFGQMFNSMQQQQQLQNMMQQQQMGTQPQQQQNMLAMSNPQLMLQMQAAAALGMTSQQQPRPQQQQQQLQSQQQQPQQQPQQQQSQLQPQQQSLSQGGYQFNMSQNANAALAGILAQQGFTSQQIQQLGAPGYGQGQQPQGQVTPQGLMQPQSFGSPSQQPRQPGQDQQQQQQQQQPATGQFMDPSALLRQNQGANLFGAGLMAGMGQAGRGQVPGPQVQPQQGLQQQQTVQHMGQGQMNPAYPNTMGMNINAMGGMGQGMMPSVMGAPPSSGAGGVGMQSFIPQMNQGMPLSGAPNGLPAFLQLQNSQGGGSGQGQGPGQGQGHTPQGTGRPGTAGSTPRLSAQHLPQAASGPSASAAPGTPTAPPDTPAPKGRRKKAAAKNTSSAASATGGTSGTPVISHPQAMSVGSPASVTHTVGTPGFAPAYPPGNLHPPPDRPLSRVREPSAGPAGAGSTPHMAAAQVPQGPNGTSSAHSGHQALQGGPSMAQPQQYPHTFGTSLGAAVQQGSQPQQQHPYGNQYGSQQAAMGAQGMSFAPMGQQSQPQQPGMAVQLPTGQGQQPQQPQAQMGGSQQFPPGIGPEWTSSVTPQQQNLLLLRSMQIARQTGANPAQILGQSGYVWVKASQLPNPGVNAVINAAVPGMPGQPGAPQMMGAIVRIEEARALGVLPGVPPAPQAPPPGQLQSSGFQGQTSTQQPQHLASTARPASQQGVAQTMNPAHSEMMTSQPQSILLPGDASQTSRPPGTPRQHRAGSSATGTETGTPMMQPAMPQMSALPSAGPSNASQMNPMPTAVPGMRSAVDQGVAAGQATQPFASSHDMSTPNGVIGAAQASMGSISAAELNLGGSDEVPRPAMSGGDAQSGQIGHLSSAVVPNLQQQVPVQSAPPPAPVVIPPVLGGPLPPMSNLGTQITGYNTRLGPLPLPGQASMPESAYYQPLTEEDIKEMERVMQIDHDYQERFAEQQEWTKEELRKLMDDMLGLSTPAEPDSALRRLGPKLQWWERGEPEIEMEKARRLLNPAPDQTELRFEPFRVVFPRQREIEAAKGARGPRPIISLSKADLERVASEDEWLVPIRLEIDHDQYKLRETFTWNANDQQLSVNAFAANLCEDYGLPSETFIALISDSMEAQLAEIRQSEGRRARSKAEAHVKMEPKGQGKLNEEDEDGAWWSAWRSKIKKEAYQDTQEVDVTEVGKRKRSSSLRPADAQSEPVWQKRRLSVDGAVEPTGADSWEVKEEAKDGDHKVSEDRAMVKEASVPAASPFEELRTLIKLDITVGNMNLIDQFEWDLGDSTSSPEQFAEIFTADLGLSGEFKTAIAHQIREQITVFLKSLSIIGHPFNGAPIADEELRASFLPAIDSCERTENQVDSYTPKLLQLSEAEIDKLTKERERDARRKRRQTKGRRGVQLPDREPNKTQRSPLVYGLIATTAASASREVAAPALGFGAFSGLSTRRAAAIAASQSFASGLNADSSNATPAPGELNIKLNQKRVRHVNPDTVHQSYPGGLGRKQEAVTPRFTPSAPPKSPTIPRVPMDAVDKRPGPGRPRQPPVRPPELAHLQPNLIDGMWHCSNCGIPGSLGPGRRKGPLGDKTLCSICGKYFHRYRRVPEVEYSRDTHYHIQQQRARAAAEAEKKAQDALNGIDRGAMEEGGSGRPLSNGLTGSKSSKNSLDGLPFQEVGSPDDSDSEESEIDSRSNSPTKRTLLSMEEGGSPGAMDSPSKATTSPSGRISTLAGALDDRQGQTAAGGTASGTVVEGSNDTSGSTTLLSVAPATPGVAATNGSAVPSTPPVPSGRALSPGTLARMPEWISNALHGKRALYPQDNFEIQLRTRPPGTPAAPEPEWRVRCLDCPGRLYTLGPGRTLDNFEIHLKNRGHRANVRTRIEGTGSGS